MQDGEQRELIRTVRRIEFATRRAVNSELVGRYHSVFKGQGMAFSEVRPYAPGDDIRHIDWNVSARHEGLFVKQFVEERELTMMLLVDMSASGLFGTKEKDKRRLLAEVAAVLAFSAMHNNDRVGLLLFTDTVEHFLPPRKGRAHVLRVVRDILEAKPKQRGTRIDTALAYFARVQKKRSVCFLLSDFLTQDWERSLRLTLVRHDVIAIRVNDRAEYVLPNLGLLTLVDRETDAMRVVDSSHPKVRALYEQRQLETHRATTKTLQQLGCDGIELRTDREFLAPLIGFFQNRARRLRAGR